MNTIVQKTIGSTCAGRVLFKTIAGHLASAAGLLLVGLAFASQAHAQGGVPLWTNRYNGPGNSFDYATAIAVDSIGNVFISGVATATNGYTDYVTIKYSSAGALLWSNFYHGPGNVDDSPSDMAVDSSGKVYVTGSSGGDYATVAYSNAGVPLWTNRYDGGLNDCAKGLAVDSSGNVFVTGESKKGNVTATSTDYLTIKYSNAGLPLWTNRYDGNISDSATDIAVDGNGNVFVTGSSYGEVNLYSDWVTVAYSGAGVPLWTNRYGYSSTSADFANAMAVDTNGNIFVTGESSRDYATVEYSSEGVPLWTNRYNGPANGADGASAIAVDRSGNVFVTGTSEGSANNFDYATLAYSGAGVPLWTKRYNGPAGDKTDFATAVAVDSSGNVFVTGYSMNRNTFPFYYDYATLAYSGAGVPLWTKRYNGLGNESDFAAAIAVDRSGNVFVTGQSLGSAGDYDCATIKYSSSIPPIHLAIERDGSGGFFIRFTGAPDVTYRLQRAPSVTGAWSNLATNTAPASGLIEYHETSSLPGQAFYRTVTP